MGIPQKTVLYVYQYLVLYCVNLYYKLLVIYFSSIIIANNIDDLLCYVLNDALVRPISLLQQL